MPTAFTFNSPTEVEDAADNYPEFQKLGAEVYVVTTNTHFSHKVWHDTSPAVGKAKFPLVDDPTHTLTKAFDMHIAEEGMALRGSRDDNYRKPSFSINRPSENHGPRFAGLPMGHEFTSLILALLQIGGYPPKVDEDRRRHDRAVQTDHHRRRGWRQSGPERL